MNSLQSPEVSDYSEEMQYGLWHTGLKQLIVASPGMVNPLPF